MKTIREIADELGIDKQKVYRFIKQNHIKNCINEAHQTTSMMYFDDAAETRIKRHFQPETTSSEAHHDAHQTASNDAVFDTVDAAFYREVIADYKKREEDYQEQIKTLLKQQENMQVLLKQAQDYNGNRPFILRLFAPKKERKNHD